MDEIEDKLMLELLERAKERYREISGVADLVSRICSAHHVKINGIDATLEFCEQKGCFVVVVTNPDSVLKWRGHKINKARIEIFSDDGVVARGVGDLHLTTIGLPVKCEYMLARFIPEPNSTEKAPRTVRAIVGPSTRSILFHRGFSGAQCIGEDSELQTCYRECFNSGHLVTLEDGIAFAYEGEEVKVFNFGKQMVVEMTTSRELTWISDFVRKIIFIVGFATGRAPLSSIFVVSDDGDLHSVLFEGGYGAEFDTRFSVLSTSPYDYYPSAGPAIAKAGEVGVPCAEGLDGGNICRLLDLLYNDEMFSNVFFSYCEIIQNRLSLNHISMADVLSVIMEQCARRYERDSQPPVLLSGKTVEDALLEDLVGTFSEFKKCYPEEDKKKYAVIEDRLKRVVDHKEGNNALLRKAFSRVASQSPNMIREVLELRNKLLHSSYRIKGKFDPDDPSEYIVEAEKLVYDMNFVLAAYILLEIGYEGVVMDKSRLQQAFLFEKGDGPGPYYRIVAPVKKEIHGCSMTLNLKDDVTPTSANRIVDYWLEEVGAEATGASPLEFRLGIPQTKYTIELRTNDNGMVPHFHVFTVDKNFDTCVCLKRAAYFEHAHYKGNLNTKERKALQKLMLISVVEKDGKLRSNWRRMADEWSRNDARQPIEAAHPQPNYRVIEPYKC